MKYFLSNIYKQLYIPSTILFAQIFSNDFQKFTGNMIQYHIYFHQFILKVLKCYMSDYNSSDIQHLNLTIK